MEDKITQDKIIETPAELEDRDLDLVAGGWGGTTIVSSRGNTSGGLVAVGVLNGNSVNILGASFL